MGSDRQALFIGNQCILPNVIRHLTKPALLSATLAVLALPSLARAQSGSAGGSIGNDEKSLSGSRETPRAAEPSKPARRSKPETEAPSRASQKSSGGGNGGGWSRANGERVNADALRQITDDTGGRTEIVRGFGDLDGATARIADELSKQYYLGYQSSGKRDGRWHVIRVEVRDRSYRVRARRGYVAS